MDISTIIVARFLRVKRFKSPFNNTVLESKLKRRAWRAGQTSVGLVRAAGDILVARSMPAWLGGVLLGILNVLMVGLLNKALGVFPGMSLWGTWVYNLLGVKVVPSFGAFVPPQLDVTTVLDVGIVLGVLAAALLAREFKVRRDSYRGYLQGFAGGAMMGIGTVMVPPCNVGGFFSAISALSLSGFGMMIGLIPGAYLGGRLLMWQAERRVARLVASLGSSPPSAEPVEASPQGGGGRWRLAIVILVASALAGSYVYYGMYQLAGFVIFGMLFGMVIQRARLCFAAAFRDIFTVGGTKLMKSAVYGITIGALGIGLIKMMGWRSWDVYVFPFGLHNVVGGFIFGVGMVLAGGCGVGILWRSAEGSVRMWFAVLGGMLSAAAWPLIYGNPVGKGWLYGPKVFIPDLLGWPGAMAFTLGAIWLWYGILLMVDRRARK